MSKILLIEDNPDNRDILRTILEHFDFEVVVAPDGAAGVRLATEGLPDLILMDLSLPVIDGWEATKILKEADGTRHIPIVAVTAHVLADEEERALKAGCDAYITKPIAPNALVTEVRRILSADATPGV